MPKTKPKPKQQSTTQQKTDIMAVLAKIMSQPTTIEIARARRERMFMAKRWMSLDDE